MGVGALEGGQVDHRDGGVDGPGLGGGLDAAGGQRRPPGPRRRPGRRRAARAGSAAATRRRAPTVGPALINCSTGSCVTRSASLRRSHRRKVWAVDILVVDHPIAQSRLTVMRDETSSNAEFRARCASWRPCSSTRRPGASQTRPDADPDAAGPDRRHRAGQPAADRAGAAGRAGHGRGRVQPAARVADGVRRRWPATSRPTSPRPTWRRCPSRWPGVR